MFSMDRVMTHLTLMISCSHEAIEKEPSLTVGLLLGLANVPDSPALLPPNCGTVALRY